MVCSFAFVEKHASLNFDPQRSIHRCWPGDGSDVQDACQLSASKSQVFSRQ